MAADDDDCVLFSDALTPEVFGAYSAEAEVSISDAAPTVLRMRQQIECDNGSQSVLLWQSAVALSRSWWEGRVGLPKAADVRVLELGAGLGLCSLTAAALGASDVVATEIEPALTALQKSIESNSESQHADRITVADLPWGDDDRAASLGTRAWDVVIGTDLVYGARLHAPLLATLRRVLTPGVSTLVLAYEERGGEEAFFEMASHQLGLVGHYIDQVTYVDLHQPVRIFVGTRVISPPRRRATREPRPPPGQQRRLSRELLQSLPSVP